jgi:hypothetical protein
VCRTAIVQFTKHLRRGLHPPRLSIAAHETILLLFHPGATTVCAREYLQAAFFLLFLRSVEAAFLLPQISDHGEGRRGRVYELGGSWAKRVVSRVPWITEAL